MKQWTSQFALLTVAGAMWANNAKADEPYTYSAPHQQVIQNNYDTNYYSNTNGRSPTTVLYPVAKPGQQYIEPTPNCVRRPWNRRGYLCASHPDDFGVPSWRSNFRFVFGSARSFFAEPCIPEPSLYQRMQQHHSGNNK